DLRFAPLIHAADPAATRRQIAEHITHVLIGRDDFDFHDRLEDDRARSPRSFLDRHRCRDLERHFAGVDVVVGAVHQLGLHVDHRVASQHTTLESFAHALLRRLDEFTRNGSADDLVLEDEPFTLLRRLDVDHHVTVLTLTTRLANELSFNLLDALRDRLAIGNLGTPDVRVDLELALHAVDDDLEVQLAHSGDDGLASLLI